MTTESRNYMNYSGLWALVTGASSGIGWHISIELAKRGCNIIGVSNQPLPLDNLKKEVESSQSVKVVTLIQDLASEEAASSVFNYCQEQSLSVDILVNNAGVLLYGEMVGSGYTTMKSILQLHVTTPALLCRLFGERMKGQKSGYILNVSSISAVMPFPTISVYGPTKAFLRYFTRAIRTEMEPYGVNVTCLLPGATDTPLNDPLQLDVRRGKTFGIVKSPGSVAKAGLVALFRNRAVCVPGLLNKAIVFIIPLIPHMLISLIYRQRIRSAAQSDAKQKQ